MESLAKKRIVNSQSVDAVLEAHFREVLNLSAKNARFKSPTIGVEQEFFVYKKNTNTSNYEQLADFADTQRLFYELKKNPDWKIYNSKSSEGSETITRISHECDSNRYSVLKYEYPPHLLEVAFTYFDNMFSLQAEVYKVWNDLELAADACGLKILLAPFISPPAQDLEAQRRVDPKFIALAESRREFYRKRNEAIDPVAVNFPSFMAATQVQVSIPRWWNINQFLNRLYALESYLLPILNINPILISKRKELYNSVFKGLPLLNFPELSDWSISSWVGAICDSPLIVEENTDFSGITIRDLFAAGHVSDPVPLLPLSRDLQIIRPKSFGALEFRGDASATNIEEILRIAAVRFAASIFSSNDKNGLQIYNSSFIESRKRWHEQVSASSWSSHDIERARSLYQNLWLELKNRNLGEEVFLTEKGSICD